MLRQISLGLFVGMLGAINPASGTSLSFHDALDIAVNKSPNLVSTQALIQAERSGIVPAGALPDPEVFFGIENYPVSGPDSGHIKSDSMTMQKIGFMQKVPNSTKRKARTGVAHAKTDVAEALHRAEQLRIRRDTALAWLNRYYVEQKISLFSTLDNENRLLESAVRSRVAAGRGQAADLVMPRQEAVQLADQLDELSSELAKAKAALRRHVGIHADLPLAGKPPALNVDPVQSRENISLHPELRVMAAETRKAVAMIREAQSMKEADWGVELAYQKRDDRFGNMVSLQFRFELPVSPSTRQDPLILSRQKEVSKMEATLEASTQDRVNELENMLADYHALDRQLDRALQVTLPLVEQKVQLRHANYRTGKGELPDVIAVRQELIAQRLKIIALEAQRAMTAARIHFSYEENTR
ncbi:MAG: TolC family protein [Burkholderiaceae bacterium]|jgi:outer membrane protein TolC|nr:TolC family protein [Burkholderiaceae bacterium]